MVSYRVGMKPWLAPLAAVVLFAAPVAAEERTVNGDPLKLGGRLYRLWGIDAAEKGQMRQWVAGRDRGPYQAAASHRRPRRRSRAAHDTPLRAHRSVAAGGRAGLGAAMVSAGMAWAFVKYSSNYVEQEKAASAGVHTHDCAKPWA